MKDKLIASVLALAGMLGATPLSDLLGGGSLASGARVFNNFSFVRTCSGGGICAPLSAADIDVTSLGGNLSLSAGFVSAAPPGGFSTADFLIAYDVSSNPSVNVIGLSFNGAVIGDLSFAQVVETILVPGPFIAGQMQVDAPDGPLQASLDFSSVGGLSVFRVVKDVLLVSGRTNGRGPAYATISFVDQFYESEVPEPSAMLLTGLGLIVFASRRIRV